MISPPGDAAVGGGVGDFAGAGAGFAAAGLGVGLGVGCPAVLSPGFRPAVRKLPGARGVAEKRNSSRVISFWSLPTWKGFEGPAAMAAWGNMSAPTCLLSMKIASRPASEAALGSQTAAK